MPFVIYADLESLLEKIDGCKNNPEKSFTIDVYRGKYCMENFCGSFREHAKKIIEVKKKKKEVINKQTAGIIQK